jgi:hypothetical protein
VSCNFCICYRSDWLLKFLYCTVFMSSNVAGLHPIDVQDKRMCSIDLNDIVSGDGTILCICTSVF